MPRRVSQSRQQLQGQAMGEQRHIQAALQGTKTAAPERYMCMQCSAIQAGASNMVCLREHGVCMGTCAGVRVCMRACACVGMCACALGS